MKNAVILRIEPVEGGADWPDIPGLSANAATIPPEIIWQRLELWAGRYFVKRDVYIYAHGPGLLTIPDGTIWPISAWRPGPGEFPDLGWESIPGATFARSRGGFVLEDDTHYRFLGSVGYSEFPNFKHVYAAKLFAEYFYENHVAKGDAPIGATSYSLSLGGDIRESWSKRSGAFDDVMIKSGAAEALRSERIIKGGF